MTRLTITLAAAAGLTAGLAALPTPAGAQAGSAVNEIIVFGNDPCPRSTDDDIVVCARKPESERYRIPPNLRLDPTDPANRSWADRAQSLEYVGRTGTQSCSTVGPGGFTGCWEQMMRQARAERRQAARAR